MVDRNWKGASVTLLAILGFIFIITQLSRMVSARGSSSYGPKTTDEQWLVLTPQRY